MHGMACPIASFPQAIKSVAGSSAATSGEGFGPDAWSYGFPSYLTLVRDYGVRSIEMDVAYDDVGGASCYCQSYDSMPVLTYHVVLL